MTTTTTVAHIMPPNTTYRQTKRLSRAIAYPQKPLYKAVSAPSRHFVRGGFAHRHCIKDGVFIDPACGCGNFLIITYRELRLLELELLKMKVNTSQMILDMTTLLKVGVEQFYGIELKEFPCQIAQVGMWLMDHQMNMRAAEQFGEYYVRLPLTQSATIVHGNALRIDWESVVPKRELSFILGNPPFVGARTMSGVQKEDMNYVFGKLKGVGNLDYVTTWYKKAADIARETQIRCAFVSTNSVAQGEQPAILWKPLMERSVYINFGIPTFKWSNEAKEKAAVHCVIIGFSYIKTEPNINQYLLEAPTVFIERRQNPICAVPTIGIGNKPMSITFENFTLTRPINA